MMKYSRFFTVKSWGALLIWFGAVVFAVGIFLGFGQENSWATSKQNPHMQSAPPTLPPDTPVPPAPTSPPDTPVPSVPTSPPDTPAPAPVPSSDDEDDDEGDDNKLPAPLPPASPPEVMPTPEATVVPASLPATGGVHYQPPLSLLLIGLGSGLIALGIWSRQR